MRPPASMAPPSRCVRFCCPRPTAGGDTAILAAALFYSLGVVRVAGYARSLPPVEVGARRLGRWLCAACMRPALAVVGRGVHARLLSWAICACVSGGRPSCSRPHMCLPPSHIPQLATGKSLVLSGLGIAALIAASASAAAQGQGLESLWGGWHEPAAWAALLWAGLGPGAVASYLHIKVWRGWVPECREGIACCGWHCVQDAHLTGRHLRWAGFWLMAWARSWSARQHQRCCRPACLLDSHQPAAPCLGACHAAGSEDGGACPGPGHLFVQAAVVCRPGLVPAGRGGAGADDVGGRRHSCSGWPDRLLRRPAAAAAARQHEWRQAGVSPRCSRTAVLTRVLRLCLPEWACKR